LKQAQATLGQIYKLGEIVKPDLILLRAIIFKMKAHMA